MARVAVRRPLTYARALAAPLLAAVLLAACSSGNASTPPTTSAPATTQPPPTTQTTSPPATNSGGGTATLTQGANGALVFSPTTLTVSEGTTVTVKNVSSTTAHTFTVNGTKINVINQGGTTSKVKIDLSPGTYPFVCTFHQAQGMTGTLVVTD